MLNDSLLSDFGNKFYIAFLFEVFFGCYYKLKPWITFRMLETWQKLKYPMRWLIGFFLVPTIPLSFPSRSLSLSLACIFLSFMLTRFVYCRCGVKKINSHKLFCIMWIWNARYTAPKCINLCEGRWRANAMCDDGFYKSCIECEDILIWFTVCVLRNGIGCIESLLC